MLDSHFEQGYHRIIPRLTKPVHAISAQLMFVPLGVPARVPANWKDAHELRR